MFERHLSPILGVYSDGTAPLSCLLPNNERDIGHERWYHQRSPQYPSSSHGSIRLWCGGGHRPIFSCSTGWRTNFADIVLEEKLPTRRKNTDLIFSNFRQDYKRVYNFVLFCLKGFHNLLKVVEIGGSHTPKGPQQLMPMFWSSALGLKPPINKAALFCPNLILLRYKMHHNSVHLTLLILHYVLTWYD